jgi:RimJ/RimL family protein N-acetyltransferase
MLSGIVPAAPAGSRMLPAPSPERRVLEGRYVRLEPLAAAHAPALAAALGNPAEAPLYRFLADEPPVDGAAVAAWVATAAASTDPLFFACIDRATGRAVGRQSLLRITPEYGVIEIGHILWGPPMARSRLATEALFLTAAYVFDALGYRRFEWKCDALNAPSRRAALRFGFEFEGIFRQHLWVKGRNRDTAWFAMIDGDWPRLRRGYEDWLDAANFDAGGAQRRPLGACFAAATPPG